MPRTWPICSGWSRLPEAWIAPPQTRELRQLVRHRAKLVGLRSNLKCQVHAVLAGTGVPVVMSDLFGVGGHQLLGRVELAPAARARVNSVLRLIENLDFEVELFAKLVAGRLREHPGYTAIQQVPGIGPVLAAVFVAEIGDIARFDRPAQLASWAGLTPKHHESDTTVHRGRITKMWRSRPRPPCPSVVRLCGRSSCRLWVDLIFIERS